MHCLIVEDHPVTLLGLRLLIQNHFPQWRISSAISAREALQYVSEDLAPTIDLVLLDITLPDQSGIALLQYFHQLPTAKFPSMVISSASDPETMDLCRAYGACGYLPKANALGQVVHAIQIVSSGGKYFPDQEESASCAPMHNPDVSTGLTKRQKEIVDLVLAGHSNKRIAHELNLSCGTVKNYMFDLMRLLSVKSRLEMAAKIRQKGYPEPGARSPGSMRAHDPLRISSANPSWQPLPDLEDKRLQPATIKV